MKKASFRKALIPALAALLAAVLLCACGATSANLVGTSYDNGGKTYAASSAASYSMAVSESGAKSATAGSSSGSVPSNPDTGDEMTDKIIYTVSANIESTDLDKSVEAIDRLISQYGGFVQSSSVNGRSVRTEYGGYTGDRTASYTIRIPADKLDAAKTELSTIGNVLSVSTSADNITEQYYDVDSRLKAYKTEEERLLALLEKADTVADMLEIESQLSDVRYQEDTLETQLRGWQKQVDYSTLTLYVTEVRELTEVTENNVGYWQEIADGFMSSLRAVGRFFRNLLRWLVSNLPVLAVIAAALALLIALIRKLTGKKRAERRARRAEKKAAKKAEKQAKKDAKNAGKNAGPGGEIPPSAPPEAQKPRDGE